MNDSESSLNHLGEKAEKRVRALAEALAEVEAREPDHDATKLLDRAKRKAALAKFKEKQKRQLRWVPLRSAIDWLKEFNERGERCAPNERLAEIRTYEIWGALTGSDILFSKYQLGNNGFAHCLIEDDAHPKAVSRFTADDIAGASKDPQMISALIDRLWMPRELLLKLFQEKQWPVAPRLNEPSPPVVKMQLSPKVAAGPTIQEAYLAWIAQNESQNNIPSRRNDLMHMRKTFPNIPEQGAGGSRKLREDHAPASWSAKGRRPRKSA